MQQMRQWWIVPGPVGGVAELRTVSVPDPGPGQVLLQITATGTSRGTLIGGATLRSDNPNAKPSPTGNEFAGRIAALGDRVHGWDVGTRVMGRGGACHAEYTVVDAAALMPVPEALSDVEAAAIPNVFVTAHNAMVTAAHLTGADSVLITAGSSGVGTAAVQIARHLGCGTILASTRSPAKAEALMALGATGVVDTSKDGWPDAMVEQHGTVDVVIDQVGGGLFPGLLRVMSLKGRYVSVGRNDGGKAEIDLDFLARQRLQLIGVTFRTRTSAEILACSKAFTDDLLPAFATGSLKPVLDRSFTFEDLPDAHAYMISNQQFGKIMLTL